MKKLLFIVTLFCLGMGIVKAQYNVLLNFNDTNGIYPSGSLICSGNILYGMALGGTDTAGNIFSIRTDGSGYKELFSFNHKNGGYPYGSLLLTGGILYGMTYAGGANDFGVIFSIDTDGNGYKDLLTLTIQMV